MFITILRLPAVMARTGLSRSTIYEQIAKRQFPKPIKLGPRAVGWIESDITEWIFHQMKLSEHPSLQPLLYGGYCGPDKKWSVDE